MTGVLGRVAHRARRVQRPLAVLVVFAVVQTTAWTVLLPAWQGPDELSHFAYSQRLVETQSIPWFPGGSAGDIRASLSTEMRVATGWGGSLQLLLNPGDRPPGTHVSEDLWRAADAGVTNAERGDGGFTSAMASPPLYYLYASIPYAATRSLSPFDRAFAMRVFNVPFIAVVVWLTWLIAGELLAGRRVLQVVATSAVALNPQLAQLAAVINPDIMLTAVWVAFLYLAIVAIRHGPTRGRLLGMTALCVASCLIHSRGLPIVVPAAFVGGALLLRHGHASRRLRVAAAGGVGLLALVGLYASLRYATLGNPTGANVRQFVSYLWQFYLPKLGFMTVPPGPDWGVRQVFVDRFYGTYGALDASLPAGALNLLKWLSIAGIVLAFAGLWTRRAAVRRWPDVVALFPVAAVAYLYFIHTAAFRSLLSGEGDPVLTGRYLLPFVPVYGLAFALGVGWLPRRASAVAAGVVVGAFGLLAVAALGVTYARYYA